MKKAQATMRVEIRVAAACLELLGGFGLGRPITNGVFLVDLTGSTTLRSKF